MKKAIINYSFPAIYADILDFSNGIDWDNIGERVSKDVVAYLDISQAVNIFPHLELDSKFALICYVTSSYYGLWGKVAAVRNCCDVRPRLIRKDAFLGAVFDFPRYSFPPMDAIFNDGTPEGYLEAVLLADLLMTIPSGCPSQVQRVKFINTPPSDFNSNWDIYERLPTWTPLFMEDDEKAFVFTCKHQIEDGIGASDGLDSIRIHKCTFYPNLSRLHKFDIKLFSAPGLLELRTWIHADSRYDNTHRCSAFKDESVLVAREKKDGTAHKT